MNLLAIKLLAALALVAAVFGFGWHLGSEHTQAQWDREKAELNAQAAQEIAAANQRVLDAEHAATARIAQAEQAFTKKLQEKQDAEIAAVERARTDGLFINAECPSAADPVSSPAGNTGRGARQARVKLPATDGEFLVRLAAEADRVTEQLSACQDMLQKERGR